MFGRQHDKEDEHENSSDTQSDTITSAGQTVVPENANPDFQHPGVPLDEQTDAQAADEASTAAEAGAEAEEDSKAEAEELAAGETAEADESKDEKSKKEPEIPSAAPIVDISGPAGDFTVPADPANVNDELIDIKKKALTDLVPIADQLDQPPVDKFRTLMMMIQASDDQKLVKAAFEAAEKIEDEKVRAQALLDVVNEINYFTQPHHD